MGNDALKIGRTARYFLKGGRKKGILRREINIQIIALGQLSVYFNFYTLHISSLFPQEYLYTLICIIFSQSLNNQIHKKKCTEIKDFSKAQRIL